MSNPWDAPPKPATADVSEDIYTAVGKALSNWELVEAQLGEIFSIFVRTPVFLTPLEEPAMWAYGSVVSFNGRADMLEAAARGFFHGKSKAAVRLKFRSI